MLFRILKKDLSRKKGINFIVFLFMIMATIFVASSVNNIFTVMNATEYCMEKGKIPDACIYAYEQTDGRSIEAYLKENEYVTGFSSNKSVLVNAKNVMEINGQKESNFELNNIIMMQSNRDEHLLLFDRTGKKMQIESGEIAMLKREMERIHVKEGDQITFQFGDYQKTFIVQQPFQDPAFGSELTGLTRYLISQSDYQEIEKNCEKIMWCYGVNTTDNTKFMQSFNNMGFDIVVSLDKDMFEFSYIVQLVIAAILIVLGVCLIVISFLVLRFTIMFTLCEEYKEIGVMKAIGIKNHTIRKTYLIKYFVLISVAAIIGCIISIPVSSLSLKLVTGDMMIQDDGGNKLINVICAVVIMLIVMLFCLISSRKIKQFSAIEVIRNGTTGERFNRKSIISLKKTGHMAPVLFLALNDILSEMKKYIILVLTFIVGTILTILSLNTLESLSSEEMAKNFALDTSADVYFDFNKDDDSEDGMEKGTGYVEKMVERLEKEMRDAGYETDISTIAYYSLGFSVEDSDEVYRFMTFQTVGSDGSYVQLVKGYTPILENEIAMSERVMKKMDVKIGDTVYMRVRDKVMKMIITASYSNFMQMGESVMLNSKLDLEDVTLSGIFYQQMKLSGVENKKAALKDIREKFPEYEFFSMKQAISSQLGGIGDMFDSIRVIVIMLICGINILITVLMVKIFIKKEKGQIGMLRALGFSVHQLKLWQMFRIGILLLISTLLGIMCSTFLNDLLVKPVFAMMGAEHMKIQVNIVESYCICPLLLLVVTCVAAYITSRDLKKLEIMEINNIE